jgi:hypothetical protein
MVLPRAEKKSVRAEAHFFRVGIAAGVADAVTHEEAYAGAGALARGNFTGSEPQAR